MNVFGDKFRVEVFGESHGAAIGVVVDGAKAGIPLRVEDFLPDLKRRKSGAKGTTPRVEADEPVILSGVLDGRTTGAPIAVIFKNADTRPTDYESLRALPRPGHADLAASVKWGGLNDLRGGGPFSGRMTLALVAAGVVAKKMMQEYSFKAELVELGGERDKSLWNSLLDVMVKAGDSVGGIVECRIAGVEAGLGEPFFNSVESVISHLVFAVPGVRGIEFGDGFEAARMRGSEHNDPFVMENGTVRPAKNGAGGINGGISNGGEIVFRVAFKPTSSISLPQRTLNVETGDMDELRVRGRHDACFALRTPVIVEACAAIALAGL